MSTNPIDVIANEVRAAGHVAAGVIAERVANALSDDRIVEVAVAALKADGWEETHGRNGGHPDTLSDEDLANIARTVLRSVSGQ